MEKFVFWFLLIVFSWKLIKAMLFFIDPIAALEQKDKEIRKQLAPENNLLLKAKRGDVGLNTIRIVSLIFLGLFGCVVAVVFKLLELI
ncbi:hypothetical protein NCY59_03500 [Acinetobacter radioresistens]|uniref:hypothetical protein n=1 Tax=Acinetobacter radioresistens TaxID=40216 RepID=UPI00202FF20C|nr:hypothetical protein [Acinetobacter radioresistens]MCM1934608.1 hypothetical protein [Acinetobacter radioresistens]MCM1952105.1 hypothetical protein [Acinetobacter radioresistens]